jgi:hypothetical protein
MTSPAQTSHPVLKSRRLVAVVVAGVGPPPSIRRPHFAPAPVVGGIGERRADECKAMEAAI